MEKLKALFTAEADENIAKELESVLDITYAGWYKEQRILSKDEMVALMPGTDILITSYDPVTAEVMDASDRLKMIVCTRATPVNIDIEHAKKRGIKVSYAPGRNSDCTAEFTVALMLSITRRIPMAFKDLHEGRYTGETKKEISTKAGLRRDVTWSLGKDTPYITYKGFQMHGHTLGIIGYGSIGRRVGAICHAFGMNIIVSDPFLTQDMVEDYVTLKPFDQVLSEADIITVHCKDVPGTQKLINADAFAKMKPTAYFVNTSRGAVIDEEALIDALRSKKIAGAAVDVYDSEPIAKDHPFLTEFDNVVTTPHLAGATYDAITNHTRMLVDDVNHFLRGEELEFEYK